MKCRVVFEGVSYQDKAQNTGIAMLRRVFVTRY